MLSLGRWAQGLTPASFVQKVDSLEDSDKLSSWSLSILPPHLIPTDCQTSALSNTGTPGAPWNLYSSAFYMSLTQWLQVLPKNQYRWVKQLWKAFRRGDVLSMFPSCLLLDCFTVIQINTHCDWLMRERGRAWHRCPENEISSHISMSLKRRIYLTLDMLLILMPGQLGVHCSVIIPTARMDISMSYAVKPGLDLQLYNKRKTNEDWFSLNYYPCINIQRAIASCNSYGFCHSWQFMVITGLGLNLFHLPTVNRYSFHEAYLFAWHPSLSPGPKYNY